jgi:pimeloyl-ACP methyl ester carboxylesterase
MDAVESPSRDYRREIPADDDTFAVYESFYRYDSIPLDSRLESVDDSSQQWRIERVSFAAAYGDERVPALLLLPKHARPSYQTVVYFPGPGPWSQRSSPPELGGEVYWVLPVVRSGRAVLFPVYKGMYERHAGPVALPHIWRDVIIHSAKDIRRAVDYLETRPDIDARNLAYFGLSSGAGLGPIMTAVEPRFRASILLAGGLHSQRRPPESEAFNFLPRVKVPTLMLNGRHDFFHPVETSQVPMFDLIGTPLADKRRREFASGHVPTERLEVIKEMLDWLDRYLGPVGGSGQ